MENHQFIPYKNSTVFYSVSGQGKTVMLIHGFGEDGSIWNEIVKKLKNNFRVIVPDIPGSGKSTILNNENAQVTIYDYAEVMIHVLKNESVVNCAVIGHSMGGYIALAIADKYPAILTGFGLFHSTAFADNEERKQARLKSIDFLQSHDAISFLRTSIPGLFADKFKKEHADEVEKLIDAGMSFGSETLIQYQKAMLRRPERTRTLQKAVVPVLFIIGEKDPAIPLEQSLAQCHLPSVVSVHILPNAGHMGMLEETELCTGAVVSFLNNV